MSPLSPSVARGLSLVAALSLAASAIVPAPPGARAEAARPGPPRAGPGVYSGVRLSYYTLSGRMYSGGQTFEGAAAANLSWLPIGTRFRLDCLPGQVYTVLDTGLMPPQWVDLWVGQAATGDWLTAVCGDWVTVRVVDPETGSLP